VALTISVITPSYNQGRFIERTIRSVSDQDEPALEHFVVDGGSSDETLDILRAYETRVRWVSEKDNGQADAVNKGIKATTGDIIGWLNSDDIYYPGALAAVSRFFEDNPECHVVYGNADHIHTDDRVIEPYYTEDWDYERLKEICFICQPALFLRRNVTEWAGFLDDSLRYCMDYEYWLRLGESVPFARINNRLAGSRMYEENKTVGSRVAVHREMNDMLRNRLGVVPDKWIYNYAHAVVDKKGYERDTPVKEFRYILALIRVSTVSFIRWRRNLPLGGIITMSGWAAAVFRNLARGHAT